MMKQLLKPQNLPPQGLVLNNKQSILGLFVEDKLIPAFWDASCEMWSGFNNGVFVSFLMNELRGWLPMPTLQSPVTDAAFGVAHALLENNSNYVLEKIIQAADAGAIKAALVKADGNKQVAADQLGISVVVLRNRVIAYNLHDYSRRAPYTRRGVAA